MFMNGHQQDEPTKLPIALIDILAAHQLREGLLLALLNRERTGEGAHVSVSLFDAAITALSNQATNWLMNGHIPQRVGSPHPNICPYGEVLTTLDERHIVLAVGSEQQFASLCDVLGLQELKTDPKFIDNQIRIENRTELKDRMVAKARQMQSEPLMKDFLLKGVPAGIIKNMKEVFELPKAEALVLEDVLEDGRKARRVSQVAFRIS
jgi:crotonobetainyl-CoA:carnitine CoA-transferase CaiB-like acyl-CoA transferase